MIDYFLSCVCQYTKNGRKEEANKKKEQGRERRRGKKEQKIEIR